LAAARGPQPHRRIHDPPRHGAGGRNVDISVAKGETVGIVGESGSGKSVTSYAVMRILDRAGGSPTGSI
jgi:ABC-type glutathione transport system ATPase component